MTDAVLDGFHITGGHANDSSSTASGRGGGVYLIRDAEVTMTDCTLANNYGRLGGAVCSVSAAPLLTDSELRENLAEYGGALAVQMGPVVAIGCVFQANAATAGGGAVWSDSSEGGYINCSLCGNTSLDSGGGINAQASTLEIVNCLLCGNVAMCSGGALNAGGCVDRDGTGGNEITMVNCTLAENRAEEGRAIQSFSEASAEAGPSVLHIGNSLLRDGGEEIRNNDASTIVVVFSNVEGGYSGPGNIDINPPFAAAGRWSNEGTSADLSDDTWIEGDYRVLADSPCIDVGYGEFVPQDTMDLDADGDITEVVPVDVRGRPRVVRKPGQSLGESRVDMGAYEYQDSRTVYRFWSPVFLSHFYTVSDQERDRLIRDYSDVWTYEEGAGFETFADASNPGTQPVHRFWAPGRDTHFYTIDEREKNMLIEEYPDVWVYEGAVFHAHAEGQQPSLARPVYRFWSPLLISHFYTIDEQERDMLIDEYPYVWTYEGVAWYAYESLD